MGFFLEMSLLTLKCPNGKPMEIMGNNPLSIEKKKKCDMLRCTPVSGNLLFGLPLLKVAKMGISSRRESL